MHTIRHFGRLRSPMRRQFCTVESQDKLVTHSDQNGVRTLTMNNARRFNAWTPAMLEALFNEFNVAATDEDIHVVILTGRGKYYCAGVDLAGVLKPMHPQTLHDLIYRNTKLLFDQFLGSNLFSSVKCTDLKFTSIIIAGIFYNLRCVFLWLSLRRLRRRFLQSMTFVWMPAGWSR